MSDSNTMEKQYHLDAEFPNNLAAKLDVAFPSRTFLWDINLAPITAFRKKAFLPNGQPNQAGASLGDHNAQYAVPMCLGTAMPLALLNLDPGFAAAAAEAGFSWLEKVQGNLPAQKIDVESPGLPLRINYAGTASILYFPSYDNGRYNDRISPNIRAAVIVIPDSPENDDDWKYGNTPAYAMQMAQFRLWCWRQYAMQENLNHSCQCHSVILVRITGNLSQDITIRTITADSARDDALALRVIKALEQKKAWLDNGYFTAVYPTNIRSKTKKEQFQEMLEDAFVLEDPDVFALVQQYMAARSSRKALERKLKEIHATRDALAVRLAGEVDCADQGTLTCANGTYAVKHKPKRESVKSVPSVDVVMQTVGPKYINLIRKEGSNVSIEAL